MLMNLVPLTVLALAMTRVAMVPTTVNLAGLAIRAPGAGRPVRARPVPRPGAQPREARGPDREGRYRGDPARRRYAQIRFGSPGSIRVTVVLDEVGAGEVDLYVDADRNRQDR